MTGIRLNGWPSNIRSHETLQGPTQALEQRRFPLAIRNCSIPEFLFSWFVWFPFLFSGIELRSGLLSFCCRSPCFIVFIWFYLHLNLATKILPMAKRSMALSGASITVEFCSLLQFLILTQTIESETKLTQSQQTTGCNGGGQRSNQRVIDWRRKIECLYQRKPEIVSWKRKYNENNANKKQQMTTVDVCYAWLVGIRGWGGEVEWRVTGQCWI